MQTLSKRMAQHKSTAKRGSPRAFCSAIRKYGFESFEWEVLCKCETREELEAAEVRMIEAHGTLASTKTGYNRTVGGGGTAGLSPSVEARAKISKSLFATFAKKYQIKRQRWLFHNRTGIPHTEETKAKISAGVRAMSPDVRPRKVPREAWQDIKARRDAGDSFRKIAMVYGVRPETIFYICKNRGAEA